MEVCRIVVADRFAFAGDFVLNLNCARVEVGAGPGRDLVVQPQERAIGDSVVAVEKDDIFACRVFKRRIARRRRRNAARLCEHGDSRILCRIFAHDFFRPVFRSLDDSDKFPVGERLAKDGVEAFADLGFHVTARHDD